MCNSKCFSQNVGHLISPPPSWIVKVALQQKLYAIGIVYVLLDFKIHKGYISLQIIIINVAHTPLIMDIYFFLLNMFLTSNF